MTHVGWWASDSPLHLGTGRSFREGTDRLTDIFIPIDHCTRHLYCIGSSGSGKSRFARYLLCQHLHANRGITLIDAQDLQREILGYSAEVAFGPGKPNPDAIAKLGEKIVIVEPADQRFGAVGINLLETLPGQSGYQVVDGIIEIIREIWGDSYGPRMEDICRNGLLLLQELQLTVLEMLPLLSDETFRQALVARSSNPAVRSFFEHHLAGLRPAEARVWMESSRNKWSSLLLNPAIRPILGQSRSTIDFRQVINEGKWLLVIVSRDKLKESRRLVGAVVASLIHQAAITRENTPPERRYFHAIFVDEFQEFWTPCFIHVLEGARKYGLSLNLFHQNLTQPPFDRQPSIIDTILSNTHMQVVFNVARHDAERLGAQIFAPSATETKFQRRILGIPRERAQYWTLPEEREHYIGELMRQRQAEAFIKLRGCGRDEPIAATIPNVPDVRIDAEKIDILKEHAARTYCRPLDVIEREIADRWRRLGVTGNADREPPRDFTR